MPGIINEIARRAIRPITGKQRSIRRVSSGSRFELAPRVNVRKRVRKLGVLKIIVSKLRAAMRRLKMEARFRHRRSRRFLSFRPRDKTTTMTTTTTTTT
jgi:hypothetical protein